jgi:hypothetical protein
MYYVILEKDLELDVVSVAGVYEDKEIAISAMDRLVLSTYNRGYRLNKIVNK